MGDFGCISAAVRAVPGCGPCFCESVGCPAGCPCLQGNGNGTDTQSATPFAAANNLAVSFHDCGDASTDVVVKDVTPKTIMTGSTTTLTGSGSLKKDITGATYTMTMTGVLSTVLVKNCNGDASKANTCDIIAPLLGKIGTLAYQPVTFPIKAGDITGIPKVAVTVKSGLPASLETTTTTLKVTDSNGDKAICVQIMTKAATGASDISMVNPL